MAKFAKNVLSVADSLHSAAIHLLRQLRVEDRTSGIGPAQLSALSVLVFGGSLSLKQLAAVEQVKAPTMVRIVQGLVEQKLATSRPDPVDGRKIAISATPRGRSLMRRARTRRVEALAKMLTLKSKAELRELERAIELLRRLRLPPSLKAGSSQKASPGPDST